MARRAKPPSEHPLADEFETIRETFVRLDPDYDGYFVDMMRLAFFSGAQAFLQAVRKGAKPETVFDELTRYRAETEAFLKRVLH